MVNGKGLRLIVGLVGFSLILLARLFSIQILDDRYKASADNQSMIREYIFPSRGLIYDRNGRILVGNKIVYDIIVTPKELAKVEFDTLAMAKALDIDVQYIKEKFDYYRTFRSRIGWRQEVFLRHVQPENYMKFAEILFQYPGFRAIARSSRNYPTNAGGNLLGYCSEVSEKYMEKHPGEYRSGDYAGMTGIEAIMETELRGQKGYHIYLRGSNSQIKDKYRNGEMDVEAVAGKNVYTCIDAELQNYGQRLMSNKVGALVAIEPSSGEILTLVSSPCIDVDYLADFGSHFTEMNEDPYRPLLDRAVSSSYPPGSVFKLVNGLIALEEGTLTPEMRYPCNKGYTYGKDHKLGCHEHPSPLNMDQSIMMSCNGYYCHVFKNMLESQKFDKVQDAFDNWRDYACSFGFGEKLGSDFPSERQGNIPTSAYYDKCYRKHWNAHTVISLSIGQGEIGCTPLQIANLAATIANRGYYYIPHIIKGCDSLEIDPKYKEKHYTKVCRKNFEKIIPGMYRAVNAGFGSGATAWRGAVAGLDICGKTGTAQNPHGDDNSVFICFAPKENPKIAIAAYIENGGFGASWAVPIASLLAEKYLTGEISRPELEEEMMNGNLLHKVKIKKKK